MKILIPKQDESGNALSLKKFQEHSIRDILHTLDQGAVTGTGAARGALLGDMMGAGKTIQAIAVVNTVPRFRRILVICMASAVEKVWSNTFAGGRPVTCASPLFTPITRTTSARSRSAG